MADGALTMKMARVLGQEIKWQYWEVLCGHGEPGIDPVESLGKLRAWYSPKYANSSILADLDIAIVQRNTNQVVALIEVEETTCKPKVLLGNVLATLMGSQISFQGKRHLSVGTRTTLIVLAKCPTRAYKDRIAFLQEQLIPVTAHLMTPNAAIGQVVMDGFLDELELEEKLKMHIQAAITEAEQK